MSHEAGIVSQTANVGIFKQMRENFWHQTHMKSTTYKDMDAFYVIAPHRNML